MRIRATKKSGQGKLSPGHYVEGVLLGPLEVGYPMRILRDTVNGEHQFGLLTSSPVEEFGEGDCLEVVTENSVWEIIEL